MELAIRDRIKALASASTLSEAFARVPAAGDRGPSEPLVTANRIAGFSAHTITPGPEAPKEEPQTPKRKIIVIDIGTRTSLVWRNWGNDGKGGVGSVKIVNNDGSTADLIHIPTLVGFRKQNEDPLPRNFKDERDRADIGNERIEADNQEENVVSIGIEAYDNWTRDPAIDCRSAVVRGNIADIAPYRAVTRYMIRLVDPSFGISFPPPGKGEKRPLLILGVPETVTKPHRRAITIMVKQQLNADVILVAEQVCDVFGARIHDGTDTGAPLPFTDAESFGVMNIGGGTTDFAIASKKKVLLPKSYNVAGVDFDEHIVKMCHRMGLIIDPATAIAIKETLGSALPPDHLNFEAKKLDEQERHEINGSSTTTGKPHRIYITRAQVRDCLQSPLRDLVRVVDQYLEYTNGSSRIQGDIRKRGFYLMGGGGKLARLAQYLEDHYKAQGIELKFQLAINADRTVFDGLIAMAQNPQFLDMALAA
jgi:rod shape-determining protein MreB and related proteins